MDIQDLVIFSRVAALQNLSAVGSEMGLTPGTISKRIQALEEVLDVRLFERTTRSIRITDEGSRFLDHVERMLAELEEAKASMATCAGKAIGKLKISAPHVVGRQHLTQAIFKFQEKYPDIDVQLDITDRTVNLHEEGYDIAIRIGALTDSSLIAKRLCDDRVVLAASPDYLAKYGRPATPSALATHQCLVLGDLATWNFIDDGADASVRVSGRFRSDSGEVLRLAALAGHGIVRSTELRLAGELESGQLESILPRYIDNNSTGVWAIYVSGRHLLPRHRYFLDHLADWFRGKRRAPELVGAAYRAVPAII